MELAKKKGVGPGEGSHMQKNITGRITLMARFKLQQMINEAAYNVYPWRRVLLLHDFECFRWLGNTKCNHLEVKGGGSPLTLILDLPLI